jgi:hypothetical protein
VATGPRLVRKFAASGYQLADECGDAARQRSRVKDMAAIIRREAT